MVFHSSSSSIFFREIVGSNINRRYTLIQAILNLGWEVGGGLEKSKERAQEVDNDTVEKIRPRDGRAAICESVQPGREAKSFGNTFQPTLIVGKVSD